MCLLTKLKYILLLGLSLSLVQCGKPGEEEKFEVTLTSSSPLVHDVERTVGDVVINSNWFELSFSIANGMTKAVRVEDISVYVTVDGVESGPHSFDLGSLSFTDDTGRTYNYGYCTYAAGSNSPFRACLLGTSDPTDTTPDYVATINFYVDSLPKPRSPLNLAFPAKMVIKGVILDGYSSTSAGTEDDRFEKTVFFTTR